MEGSNKNAEVINISVEDLEDIKQLQPNKRYNIDTHTLLSTKLDVEFSTICQLLTTTTSVKVLILSYWLDVADLQLLGETLLQNQSIEFIKLDISQPIHPELFKNFIERIRSNKILKTIELATNTLRYTNIQLLESMKGLYMPTKGFQLSFTGLWRDLETDEFYLKQIEVLQTTNINKLVWTSRIGHLDGGKEIPEDLKGFTEFCDHVVKQNTLKVFIPNMVLNNQSLPYMVKIVSGCKTLKRFDLQLGKHAPYNIQNFLDALANSNIRKLKLIGLNAENNKQTWHNIAKATKSMKKLTDLEINGYHRMNVRPFVPESLRRMKFGASRDQEKKIIADLMLQNKKRQNERVRTILSILFNIARATSSQSSIMILPRDIWPVIMSSVHVPGVSLDFERICHSIFKDNTVRRVIYKPVKRIKKWINVL